MTFRHHCRLLHHHRHPILFAYSRIHVLGELLFATVTAGSSCHSNVRMFPAVSSGGGSSRSSPRLSRGVHWLHCSHDLGGASYPSWEARAARVLLELTSNVHRVTQDTCENIREHSHTYTR